MTKGIICEKCGLQRGECVSCEACDNFKEIWKDNGILVDKEFGGAIEDIDERNFLGDDFERNIPESPKPFVIFNENSVLAESQGTTVSCTAQAATNAVEIQFFNQTKKKIKIDSFDQWEYQKDVYPRTYMPGKGDMTSSGMKALVHRTEKMGGVPAYTESGEKILVKVDGYATVKKDFFQMIRWMSAGYSLVCSGDVLKEIGKNVSNFSEAKTKGVLRFPQNSSVITGHAFCLFGYQNQKNNLPFNWINAINSYGDDWGFYGNGSMVIPENEVKFLHQSVYVPFVNSEEKRKKIFAARSILWASEIQERAKRISDNFDYDDSALDANDVVKEAAAIKNKAKKYLRTH